MDLDAAHYTAQQYTNRYTVVFFVTSATAVVLSVRALGVAGSMDGGVNIGYFIAGHQVAVSQDIFCTMLKESSRLHQRDGLPYPRYLPIILWYYVRWIGLDTSPLGFCRADD